MAATTTATPTACPNCSSVDLINDQFTNDLMCCSCGALVQENRLVSEVGFTEAGGKKSVVGQTIDWSTMTSGNGVAAGGGRVSRDITMQRARRNIESFAVKLKIPATMQDQANRVFGLAVDKNFNRGRKSMLVAAACLYVVCRNQQSPLLLLDFADASVFSVKEIGTTYIKLITILRWQNLMNVPVIDPSLFMERFSAQLDLGEDAHKQPLVASTACRIVQQMKRDWLNEGRRPTGLCGAALLIALRCHNIFKSPEEVARVVRMAESTLRQRLFEMRSTSVAGMTKDQVEAIDPDQDIVENTLPTLALPPSMLRSLAKGVRKQALEDAEAVKALENGGGGQEGSTAGLALMDGDALMEEGGEDGGTAAGADLWTGAPASGVFTNLERAPGPAAASEEPTGTAVLDALGVSKHRPLEKPSPFGAFSNEVPKHPKAEYFADVDGRVVFNREEEIKKSSAFAQPENSEEFQDMVQSGTSTLQHRTKQFDAAKTSVGNLVRQPLVSADKGEGLNMQDLYFLDTDIPPPRAGLGGSSAGPAAPPAGVNELDSLNAAKLDDLSKKIQKELVQKGLGQSGLLSFTKGGADVMDDIANTMSGTLQEGYAEHVRSEAKAKGKPDPLLGWDPMGHDPLSDVSDVESFGGLSAADHRRTFSAAASVSGDELHIPDFVEENFTDVKAMKGAVLNDKEAEGREAVWGELHKDQLQDLAQKKMLRIENRKKRGAARALMQSGVSSCASSEFGGWHDGMSSMGDGTESEGGSALGGFSNASSLFGGLKKRRVAVGRKKTAASSVVSMDGGDSVLSRDDVVSHFHTSKQAESKYNPDDFMALFDDVPVQRGASAASSAAASSVAAWGERAVTGRGAKKGGVGGGGRGGSSGIAGAGSSAAGASSAAAAKSPAEADDLAKIAEDFGF